jgi:hypothetical protein
MIKKIYILLSVFLLTLSSNAFAVAPEKGWWWNPTESGSGYAIERQGNSIFMAAFLYETTGAATWYATLLTLQPDGSYKGDMTRYVGGKSLLGSYKAPTSTSVVATATASFPKPDSGTMTITFPNGAPNRTIPISRFGFASPSFEPSKGSFQNGWWWNDQESGTGYFVEVQGDKAFIASFMYDTTGQPTWYASLSSLTGTNLLSGALDMYANGQALGGAYKAPAANAGGAGSMSYGFTNDSLGSMTLPNAAKVAIKRFAFDSSAVNNHPPVPNAGTNQTVTVGDTVNLSGTGTDSDGDALTFSWRLLSAPAGSTSTLTAWSTSKANFVADVVGTYRLELIADDGKVSNGGSVITVTSTAKAAINLPPIANAGLDKSVLVGTSVNLNGSASYDPNGDLITYSWSIITKPNGSNASLSNSNSTAPSFIADSLGIYMLGLTVNDGKTTSPTSKVIITSSPLTGVDLNKVNPKILAEIDLNEASEYLGTDRVWYNLLTKGDINGDGYEDLVIGLFRVTSSPSYSGRDWDPSGEIKPVILFYDPVTDKYVVNKQVQAVVRKNQHPRQAVIADFDGDGRNDLFIGDHGYDDAPYGNQNTLLLNKVNGFLDGTNLLPQYTDFSHGLVVADFDNNGKPDLLILNNTVSDNTKCTQYPVFTECPYNPPKHSESYVLFNNGISGLVPGKLNIPDEVINFTKSNFDKDLRLYVGHSADFNSDGWPDLVISNHKSIFILESKGKTGEFSPAQEIAPPSALSKCQYTPASAITSLDLDEDGINEIIASSTCDLYTAYFRVFKRNSSGIWEDKSSIFLGDQTANTSIGDGWCYKFELADINWDGKKDLICQSVIGQGTGPNNVFWLNINGKLQDAKVTLPDSWYSGFQTMVEHPAGSGILGFNSTQKSDKKYYLKIRRWNN